MRNLCCAACLYPHHSVVSRSTWFYLQNVPSTAISLNVSSHWPRPSPPSFVMPGLTLDCVAWLSTYPSKGDQFYSVVSHTPFPWHPIHFPTGFICRPHCRVFQNGQLLPTLLPAAQLSSSLSLNSALCQILSLSPSKLKEMYHLSGAVPLSLSFSSRFCFCWYISLSVCCGGHGDSQGF